MKYYEIKVTELYGSHHDYHEVKPIGFCKGLSYKGRNSWTPLCCAML